MSEHEKDIEMTECDGPNYEEALKRIRDHSEAHKNDANTMSVSTYFEGLQKFCNDGWAYGEGYNASKKTIDCAYYPYEARGKQGAHGCTTEYNSDLIDKGPIANLGGYDGLVPGMEVFQGTTGTKEHMGVYCGKKTLDGKLQHAVYQSCSSHNTIDFMYPEPSGPNITGMNKKWLFWGWSKYVTQ